jgi:probable rRNA maturation factor
MKQPGISVKIQIDTDLTERVDGGGLTRAARATLRQQGVAGPAELTLVVTGDGQVRRLNRTYRGVDGPTDVLAFGDEPGGRFASPPGAARYLGDVIISFPRAEAQARQAGHAVAAELQLLAVHGVLHLLGHDHDDADRKATMWHAQAEILGELGSRVADPAPEG